MDESEEQTSRLRFLKRVGVVLAAGLGVSALGGATTAEADIYTCCPDNTNCSGTCPPNKIWHLCRCPGSPDYTYCGCFTNSGHCFASPC